MRTVRPSIEATAGEILERAGCAVSGPPVVVAVSGGLDSVVAAHVVRALGYPVLLAHVHHGLRGAPADGDAAFVEALGRRWDSPARVIHLGSALVEDESGSSMQERARELRYAGLERVATDAGASVVVTGHHRDDQAETVLLQLLRGSGPDGLAAMPEMRAMRPGGRVRLVRPLLGASRSSLEAYARRHGLAWREDESNAASDYLRNALRHRVLPALDEAVGGDAASGLARSAAWMRAYVDSDLDGLTEALFRTGTTPLTAGGLLLRDAALVPLPDVWRGRLVLRCLERVFPRAARSRTTVGRVLELLDRQTGRRLPVPGGAVWRERNGLAFAERTPVPEPAPLAAGSTVAWGGRLFHRSDGPIPAMPESAGSVVLDGERLPDGLTVRTWQPGDRLVPAGMHGSRKVKDLLTDARMPAHGRAHAAVVATGAQVVWLVGVRADGRYLASDGCRHPVVLRVTGP